MEKIISMTYLERRKPNQNLWRFYTVTFSPTLFGQWALIRRWGRIGCTGQYMEQWFNSLTEAQAAGRAIIAAKQKRGYKVS